MDPDLRAYLEAMEQRTTAKIDAGRQETAAARAVAEAALREAIAGRSEARVLHETTLDAIRALGEGLTKHQSEQIDRHAAERHRVLMDQHIRPLEASAADHEHRITVLEQATR